MKYPKEYLNEIKTRLKVSTVVSRSVSLKKRGKEFVGLSPFKTEKTPSFTVNDEKEFYHCFATSEHGNIFDFVMKTQNLKFGEAVKFLANLAGMQPYTFSKQDVEREKKWKDYSFIYNEYSKFYHEKILRDESSKIAREYLKKRNLTKNDVVKFQIGYVENKPYFYEKIKEMFSKEFLLESGIFYFDEKNKVLVERFKNRIIFPIKNISGQIIAFGGRIFQDESYLAKYINSPETIFFKKGSNLYNLDIARKLSNKIDHVFLVEGYMDVIGLNKNGIENVVANLGTSLTERQITILNQFFNDIVICFDGDESGYKAALRAAENSIKELKPEKKISFLFLPEKDDPDSFVNKNGKEVFLKFASENKVPIHKFIFNHYIGKTNKDPSSLAILEKNLRSIANSIKDNFIKKYILESFLEGISDFTPHSNFSNKGFYQKKARSLKSTQKHFNESKSLSHVELKEISLLYIILNNLKIAKENIETIENIKFFTNENKVIFEKILSDIKNGNISNMTELGIDQQLIDKIFKFASIKHILNNYKNNPDKIFDLLKEIIRDLKNYELEHRIEELESKFSKDLSESTFNELKKLKKLQKIN